jgi:hypothetical protein
VRARGDADGRRDQGVDGGEEEDEEAIHAGSTLPPRWGASRGARQPLRFWRRIHDRYTHVRRPFHRPPRAPRPLLRDLRRGSTIGTEIRGGIVTFVTMAYIVILNPIILSGTPDVEGTAGGSAVAAATALTAGRHDDPVRPGRGCRSRSRPVSASTRSSRSASSTRSPGPRRWRSS